ncbi:hypothetical protein [Tomitella fengzijianii]|uniref:Uncharacterized protein n=1 Tax=Tomitella fengzijianii TaxID=2597660 RepID=A0A516WZD3_9ACTN|nr:hypothetical protein [Tomitella fengzijianii]QDQ96183.1 hypothetical protein FO059_01030 [Tomitella fengzijianii]
MAYLAPARPAPARTRSTVRAALGRGRRVVYLWRRLKHAFSGRETPRAGIRADGAAADDAAKKDVLTRIQQRMNETLPWQPWGASPNLDVWRSDVHGVKVTFDEIMLFDDAWIG